MVATAEPEETDLCYTLSYGKNPKGYKHNVLIKPITAFPQFHPVVKRQVCQQFKAGDRIPGTKFASEELAKDPAGFDPATFAKKFNRTKIPRWTTWGTAQQRRDCKGDGNIDMDCIDRKRGYANCNPGSGYMNAGAFFYGYDFPKTSSANTGYEEKGIGKFYFVSDEDHDGWLIAAFDKPSTNGGGAVKFTLDINTEEPAFIAARDDPNVCAQDSHYTKGLVPTETCPAISGSSTCVNYVHPAGGANDCFHWAYDKEKQLGRGSFDLAWGGCCTDGIVFGPISDSSFSAQIEFQKISKLKYFKVGTYNASDSNVDFRSLSNDEMMAGIKIAGGTCDSYCSFIGDCRSCFQSKKCGWCNQNNKCLSAAESDTCVYGWVPWVPDADGTHDALCYQDRPTTTVSTKTPNSTITTTMDTTTTPAPVSSTTTTTTAPTTPSKSTTTAAAETVGPLPSEKTDCSMRLSAGLLATVIIPSLL